MEKLLNLAMTYWPSILIVVVLVAVLIYLWKKGRKKTVLSIVNSLVVEAEKYLGTKTGEYKKDKVIETFYSRLPVIITVFVTRKELEKYIDDAAAKLKEFLKQEENNLNGLSNLESIGTYDSKIETK